MDNEVTQERLILKLQKVIAFAVRSMAVLMTMVILWGVVDVVFVLYRQLKAPPYFMLNINDMLEIFGAFLAVLIAIEIYINITIYLREKMIHVKIVLATALMAIARKVIVFDFDNLDPMYVFASAMVVFALSIAYWLVTKLGNEAEVVQIQDED